MNWLQYTLVFALRGYQRVISPALMGLFGPLSRCRFEPTCSEYAIQAVRSHGGFKGAVLAAWRLCRCNPWCDCGADPVPEKFQIANFKSQMKQESAGTATPRANASQSVAQSCTLLYRRLAAGMAAKNFKGAGLKSSREIRGAGRLKICDTAEFNSALQARGD